MRDERGAVAVVVALVLVPLMGLAAFGVDVAGMWSEHQQLQNGADAGALAVAQNCGVGACGTTTATAQQLVAANHVGPGASASVVTSGNQVTVRAAATRRHLFAPVIGVESSQLGAQATASWGSPDGGTAVLPLIFSSCEWQQQTGGGVPSGTVEHTIYFTKSSGTSCTGPSGNAVPGGFGWLRTNSGTCTATSSRGGLLYSDPGNAVPSGCSVGSFSALQGRTVLLPLFDQAGDTGSNAFYHVYGYAAFTITGYDFVGQYSYNAKTCKGSAHCVRGYFTRFVDLSEAFTYSAGAPALGAAVVELSS